MPPTRRRAPNFWLSCLLSVMLHASAGAVAWCGFTYLWDGFLTPPQLLGFAQGGGGGGGGGGSGGSEIVYFQVPSGTPARGNPFAPEEDGADEPPPEIGPTTMTTRQMAQDSPNATTPELVEKTLDPEEVRLTPREVVAPRNVQTPNRPQLVEEIKPTPPLTRNVASDLPVNPSAEQIQPTTVAPMTEITPERTDPERVATSDTTPAPKIEPMPAPVLVARPPPSRTIAPRTLTQNGPRIDPAPTTAAPRIARTPVTTPSTSETAVTITPRAVTPQPELDPTASSAAQVIAARPSDNPATPMIEPTPPRAIERTETTVTPSQLAIERKAATTSDNASEPTANVARAQSDAKAQGDLTAVELPRTVIGGDEPMPGKGTGGMGLANGEAGAEGGKTAQGTGERGGPGGNEGRQAPPGPGGIPGGISNLPAPAFNNPRPRYPAELHAASIEGSVMLRVLINAQGTVDRVKLERSSGYEAFDDSALKAVQRWRFAPAKRGRTPVELEVLVPVVFVLRSRA